MFSFTMLETFGAALAWVVGALVVGLLVEWLLMRALHAALRRRMDDDAPVVRGIRGVITLWIVLLGIYAALLGLELAPVTLVIARRVLTVLAVLAAIVALNSVVAGLIQLYARHTLGGRQAASIIVVLAQIAIVITGALVILQTLTINITPILTTLGVGGLAVALALQDTLSNLFAGIQIIAARKIAPGDMIKLESGEEGSVTDISWRNTTIRLLSNSMAIVPNAKLASAIVINHDLIDKEFGVSVALRIGYDADLARVEAVTLDVARAVQRDAPGADVAFEPSVSYNAFDDWSVRFSVNLRAAQFSDQFALRHAFIKRLHERYQAEGIVIPLPMQVQVEEPRS
jgi:small-conductance mechanosensitive channel